MSNTERNLSTPSFYARLFCSSEQQALLDAAADLHREITSIPHTVSELTVAQAKLAWWRNELGSGNTGRPRHPLSRVYFELVKRSPLQSKFFAVIIEGVEDRISGVLPDSETALAMHCHKAMGAYMELLASLTLKPGQTLTPESKDFASLAGAGIYLSSHAIACAAHDQPCNLASAIPTNPNLPGETIRPVLTHAAELMHRAVSLPTGGEGLIYHHAMLKIHQQINSKVLSRAKLETGKPTQLNGFRMLTCAWQGARAAVARPPQQDT